jgi:transposase
MNAYSEDLRKKIVASIERGMSKAEVARLFDVSLSSASSATQGWLVKEGRLSPEGVLDDPARRTRKPDSFSERTYKSARPPPSAKDVASWSS